MHDDTTHGLFKPTSDEEQQLLDEAQGRRKEGHQVGLVGTADIRHAYMCTRTHARTCTHRHTHTRARAHTHTPQAAWTPPVHLCWAEKGPQCRSLPKNPCPDQACYFCFVLFCFVWLATLGVPVVASGVIEKVTHAKIPAAKMAGWEFKPHSGLSDEADEIAAGAKTVWPEMPWRNCW